MALEKGSDLLTAKTWIILTWSFSAWQVSQAVSMSSLKATTQRKKEIFSSYFQLVLPQTLTKLGSSYLITSVCTFRIVYWVFAFAINNNVSPNNLRKQTPLNRYEQIWRKFQPMAMCVHVHMYVLGIVVTCLDLL